MFLMIIRLKYMGRQVVLSTFSIEEMTEVSVLQEFY